MSGTSRVSRVVRSDGSVHGWAIHCPACEHHHVLVGWAFNGDVEHPTFSPSLMVTYRGDDDGVPVEERCHSFIRGGQIEYLSDCSHRMAGQTVLLPIVPETMDCR